MTLDHLGKNVPALDGLRGLAVVAVVLYHGGVPFCQGGFIGVEVFFVLSGFLITALLLRERKALGGIKLRHFYMRRVLRLLPALVGLILVVTPLALLLLPPEWRQGVLLDTLAALFYVQNWAWGLEWLPPGIYAHTWSLSIEEQFYILWPLTLAIMFALRLRTKTWLALTALIALSAMLWASYNAGRRPWQHSYLFTDLRVGSLFFGCFVATAVQAGVFKGLNERAKYLPAAAILGLGGLAFGVWIADTYDARYYQFGIPLVGVATSAILLEVFSAPGGPVARGLGRPALVWLGRRSYGIYLWHFPILIPMKEWGWGWAPKTLTTLLLTVVVAALSFRFLELPFLRLKKRFARRADPAPAPALGVEADADAAKG